MRANALSWRPVKRIALTVAAASTVLAGLVWPRAAASHNPVTTTVAFNREVAKVFEAKCVQCHADGSLAMPLITYEESRPWAVAIKEEVLARRMPPWPAARGFGSFANDVGLTSRELDFVISWADGGAPKGTMEPPAHVDHSSHWMLGNPDRIVTASEAVAIEAGAPVGFRRIVLDPQLTEDRWIRGLDYKPGDRRTTRAAVLKIADTGQLLGGWAPWRFGVEFPVGSAVRIPAGAKISVEVLYQAAPENTTDKPSVGLYFAEPDAVRPVRQITFAAPMVEKRGTSQHRVKLEAALTADTNLIELWPQMTPGARSLELKVKRPDGSIDVLLWVRQFRRGWATSFAFAQPLVLPKGSMLQATAYFETDPAGDGPRVELALSASDAVAPSTAQTASRRPTTAR
jgi:hypothetical protein